MDIDEEINEDKDIEDIYDDESDSFAPEDINDELERIDLDYFIYILVWYVFKFISFKSKI